MEFRLVSDVGLAGILICCLQFSDLHYTTRSVPIRLATALRTSKLATVVLEPYFDFLFFEFHVDFVFAARQRFGSSFFPDPEAMAEGNYQIDADIKTRSIRRTDELKKPRSNNLVLRQFSFLG